MKSNINYRLIGVLLALVSLIIMPVFTLFTIVLYFLELYGFPPIVPTVFKDFNWRFLILIGASIPIYTALITITWIGYRKIKDPSLQIMNEIKLQIKKVTTFFQRLSSN